MICLRLVQPLLRPSFATNRPVSSSLYLLERFLVSFSNVKRCWHPGGNDLGALRHLQKSITARQGLSSTTFCMMQHVSETGLEHSCKAIPAVGSLSGVQTSHTRDTVLTHSSKVATPCLPPRGVNFLSPKTKTNTCVLVLRVAQLNVTNQCHLLERRAGHSIYLRWVASGRGLDRASRILVTLRCMADWAPAVLT